MVSSEVLTWRNTLVRSVDRPLWEARPDSEATMHILASHVFMHFWVYFAFGFSDLQNFKITHVKILIFSAVAVGIWINSHRKKMHPYEFMVQFWIKHKREYLLFLESYKENKANWCHSFVASQASLKHRCGDKTTAFISSEGKQFTLASALWPVTLSSFLASDTHEGR